LAWIEVNSFFELFSETPGEPRKPSRLWELFTGDEDPNDAAAPAPPQPCARVFDEKSFFWAMRNLPVEEAVKHLLITGTIGSGKTTAIDLFVQSIAPRFKKDRERAEQLIIFDAKCETIPFLAGLGFDPEDQSEEGNVWIINPFDERSAVWNIAGAVQSPSMARHFAALIVPEEKQSTAPFFWSASRELVYAVILGLNVIAGDKWDLRSLICALTSRERIAAIAGRHRRAEEIAASILGDKQHSSGVISSLQTKLGQFEQVAALWATVPRAKRFSIPEFLKRPGVLVLGNDPVLRESLWPINAIILKSLTQEIMRQPETDLPRHWFVLDEFTAMEKVDSIHEIVNRGRSKGASVLIGLQGIDKLKELYRENGANDLLEQLSYKTFLRAGGSTTAEWIEKFVGKYRQIEAAYSESWSQAGASTSLQYQVVERSALTASYFMNMPFTGKGKPYIAVSDIPCFGATIVVRRWFDEINRLRIKPNSDFEAIRRRTEGSEQTIRPWDSFEIKSFCGLKGIKKDSESFPDRESRRRRRGSPEE